MSDYKGAAMLLPALPYAKELLAGKGYDADWLREALAKRNIHACIPARFNRIDPAGHDKALYRQRHKIENMFGRLKGWRRIHNPLRQMRPHLLLGHLNRSRRHIPIVINEP